MAISELNELEEQEKMMKQMVRKEMIAKIESKIRSGDKKLLIRIRNLISEDEKGDNK